MRKVVLGLAVGMAAVSTAQAVEIFAMNNLHGTNNGTNMDALIRFDSATPGTFTTIGVTGVANSGFGGLDFSGSGQLYGWASFALGTGAFDGGLYSVNPGTGAATRISAPGVTLNMQDLAWNPVSGQMVGVNSAANVCTLYNINLATGATAPIGVVTGLPATNLEVGLAYDSTGAVYIHDIASDVIYRGAGLAVTALHTLPQNTNFSQGMTVDWSNGNQGYHATIGNTPAFFATLNTFNATAGSYAVGGSFGLAPNGLPSVEAGDIAIRPIPAPGVLALAAAGLLVGGRRRRR
jgi:hypothetical protein